MKPKHTLFFIAFLLAAFSSRAQDSGASDSLPVVQEAQDSVVIDTLAVIREIQDSLATDTTAEKKSFFYKIFNQTRPVTYLAFPLVYYTPETNLMLGVGGVVTWRLKNDSTTAPTYIIPWVTYSIDHQMNIEIFGSLYHKGNKHQLEYELNYRKQKQPFYGIGNKLEKDHKEIALTKGYRFYTSYQNRIKDVFLIGPVYHMDYTTSIEAEPGKMLDTNNYVGKPGGFVQGAGIRTAFDNRDDVYFPYKGNFFEVTAIGYPTWMGSKYQFGSLKAEYRAFLNIKRKVILASQVMSQMSFGDIPFYMLPRLGGDKLLRGYTAGSARDKFLFNLQGELRVPLGRLILSGFFGSGIVGDEFMDYFKVKEYSYSIGGGARFRPFKDKNIVARLDVGFWRGTYGIYFVFNEAF